MCDLPCRENGVTFISHSTHNPRPTAPRPQPRTDLNYPLNTKQLKIGGLYVLFIGFIPLDLQPSRGTGMIASSSTFCPHPGRVIRDLFCLLDAVYGIVRKH